MAALPADKRDIFADVYRFYEKHWDMTGTVESWETALLDISALLKKHNNDRLAVNLLLGCYQTLDENIKELQRLMS
jgi:hypothetical protein